MSKNHSQDYIRAASLLLLILFVAFFDIIFLGKTFKVSTANSQALPTGVYGQIDNKPEFIPVNGTDSAVLEEPIFEFIKNNLKKGILPLWNPHQACGYPLVGMIQVGIFYPLHLILYLLPSLYSFDLLILARLFLAGFFTYCFLRSIGVKNTGALCGGIAFMLSGPMLLLQYWTANVDILLPVLLIATELLIRNTRSVNIAFLGLVIFFSVLGGHPEHIVIINAFTVFYFLFRLFSRPKKEARYFKTIYYFLLSYVLGIALASIVILPFLYHLKFEFWHGHPDKAGMLMEENRARALSLALPHFFQKVPLTYQWVFAGWWGGYLGTLPLGLAFLSLFNKKHKRYALFFTMATIIIIGKQYGVPIIHMLGHLPFFELIRYAIHTPPVAAFTVAVLAGLGTQTIIDEEKVSLKGLIFNIALIVITLGHIFVLRSSESINISIKAGLFALGIILIFQAIMFCKDRKILKGNFLSCVIIAILFSELFCYIHRERPKRYNSFGNVPYINLLKSAKVPIRSYGNFWAFYPNTATGFGVDDLGYFFGLVPERFVNFTNNLLVPGHFQKDLRPPALRSIPIQGSGIMLDLLNIKYIIAPNTDFFSSHFQHFEEANKKNDLVYDNEVKVYSRPNTFPRAFIVHRAIVQTDLDKTFILMRQIGNQLKEVVVLNNLISPGVYNNLKQSPVTDNSWAKITKYSPNEVILEANMENAGFLVLSDAFHPDWKAYVDGKETKIYQANYLLRAVFLMPGQQTVRFAFKPLSFYLGACISICAFLVVFVLLYLHYLRKKYRSS